MGHWLERNIVEPGKLPLLLALASFVLAFAAARTLTRLIRAGRGPFRDITPGGVHVHHVVPGTVLTVVGGFGALTGGPRGAGTMIAAVLFGVGAGLVLDEFALILYLQDVYWTEEGRKSVEAVVVTAALVGLVLAGFLPFGVNDLSEGERENRGLVVLYVAVNFLIALIALAKGKLWTAMLGAVVPLVALVGAVRLARPRSPWARRCYRGRARAAARARARAARHEARWSRPARRLQDLIAGAPGPGRSPAGRPEAGSGTGPGTGTAPAAPGERPRPSPAPDGGSPGAPGAGSPNRGSPGAPGAGSPHAGSPGGPDAGASSRRPPGTGPRPGTAPEAEPRRASGGAAGPAAPGCGTDRHGGSRPGTDR